jgi:predicted AAA+ superfamily ATPase
MIEDATGFRRELEKLNAHWLTGMPEEEARFPFHRGELEDLYADATVKKLSLVTGPRRSGKTVLLKHLIARLIGDGVNPRNLLYCSLDNSRLAAMSEDLVRDTIDFWLEGIAMDGPRYVLLDEVHLLDGWYASVKNFHDLNRDVKTYISGSASLAIQVRAEQHLRGRYIAHEIWPLDLRGYLSLRRAMGVGPRRGRATGHAAAGPPTDAISSDAQLRALLDDFKRYMLVGGFPESVEVDDTARWFELLEGFVAQRAIYTDIAATFNIRAVKVLDSVLHHILANQSRLLTYESINEVAGLKHEVLLDYIEYLKGSYLVVEVRKLAPTVKGQLKSRKKFLCADQGLRNALLAEHALTPDNEGMLAENVVGMHLFMAATRSGRRLFYWKEDGEVDFVVKGREALLVEVKYRNRVDEADVSKVQAAMEATGARMAYIVSKRDFEVLRDGDTEVRVIPAAVFCRWVEEYISAIE